MVQVFVVYFEDVGVFVGGQVVSGDVVDQVFGQFVWFQVFQLGVQFVGQVQVDVVGGDFVIEDLFQCFWVLDGFGQQVVYFEDVDVVFVYFGDEVEVVVFGLVYLDYVVEQ